MSVITQDLEQAIADLKAGNSVAIPTETVYGLAAMIDNPQAIQKIFAIKGRPLDHPLIVHIPQHYPLLNLVQEVPEYAQLLIEAFWPGPLTLVLNLRPNCINPLITGGQSTVAIRSPSHPLAQQLLQKLGTPVVAPSANPFGKVSPTTASDVQEAFSSQNLTILDGGRCEVGIESTIIDATHAHNYQILRHGLIDEQTIATLISRSSVVSDNNLRVSGALKSHYQPQKKLYYVDHYDLLLQACKQIQKEVYVIASKKPDLVKKEHFHQITDKPQELAYDLYYQLRRGDESSADCILIELPPKLSVWQGIRDRIIKAGSPLIVPI